MSAPLSLLLKHYRRLYPLYTNLPQSLQRGVRSLYYRLQAYSVPAAAHGNAVVFDGTHYNAAQVDKNLHKGVNIHGFLHAANGLGQHVRMIAGGVEHGGIQFSRRNYDFIGASSAEDLTVDIPFGESMPFATNLFCFNAPHITSGYHLDRGAAFKGRYNIGYGFWELARYPTSWLPSMNVIDEVWAPSKFVSESIAARASRPTVHMPIPVEFAIPAAAPRAAFRLPENKFLFLFSFDFLSTLARKNPQAVMTAFRRAFPTRDDVGLVIKVSTHSKLDGERRQAYDQFMVDVAGDKRIVVIDQILSRTEVLQLMQCCDSYVSLHRSEGFGFGMAESMLLGKPVIGTAYSGNLDFMTHANSCLVNYRLIPVGRDQFYDWQGQVWADADIDHAAAYMTKLVDDSSYCQTLGREAQRHMREHFSFAAAGARYRTRLELLGLVS